MFHQSEHHEQKADHRRGPKKFGFEEGELDLHKTDGVWYWCGVFAEDFEECCTHCVRLDDMNLEGWLTDLGESLQNKYCVVDMTV